MRNAWSAREDGREVTCFAVASRLLRMMIVGEMDALGHLAPGGGDRRGAGRVVLKATDSLGPGSGTPVDEPRTTRPDRAERLARR